MHRLRHRDLVALLEFVGELHRLGDVTTFRRRLVRAMPRLIPSDAATCMEIDLRNARLTGVTEPEGLFAGGRADTLGRVVGGSPLLRSYTRGKGSAVKLSDFVTRTELHRTEIYDEWFRPLGVEYQICKGLPGRRGYVTAMSLERSGRDWREAYERQPFSLLALVR